MAITQQIARLSPGELAECRASVEAVHRLCSFTLRDDGDHLDLDWWPRALRRALAAAQAPARLLEAVERACSGGTEINPAYRDVLDTIFEHPVTALEPAEVREVATVLAEWTGADAAHAIPRDAEQAQRLLGMEYVIHPGPDLGRNYAALRRFYGEAAEQGLATAMWWD